MTHPWPVPEFNWMREMLRERHSVRKGPLFMRKILVLIGLLCGVFPADQTSSAQSKPDRAPRVIEQGKYTIHLLLHAIGTENYTVSQLGPNRTVMTTMSTSS